MNANTTSCHKNTHTYQLLLLTLLRGGVTIDVGGAILDVGEATVDVGEATLDVGEATLDVGGATSVVGKVAEGRCILGSGPVAFKVLGRIGDRTRSEQYTCVCLCTLFVCVHVCVCACMCVFTQQHTCIMCVRPLTNGQVRSNLSSSLPKKEHLL